MPKNKKAAAAKSSTNFDPRYAKKSAPKAGSRSPNHRGYRADAAAPGAKKQRWNAEERAARRTDAPRTDGAGTERSRGGYDNRTERPNYGARPSRIERTDRPAYGDRAQRGERPAYGDRAQRGERPAYGDRAQRGERPAYGDRPQRGERPAYGDRAPRTERPTRDRPSYGDRPQRSSDSRDSRPPRRDFDTDRPRRSSDDRAPRRSFDTDRPRRSFDERPARTERSDSNFYPSRDTSRGLSTSDKARFTPQDDVVLERLEADAILATDVDGVSFGDLGLGDNITRQLAALGAASPFPIQAATIPDVLAGKDVLGRGKTGSGKTIAFGAPLVERLMENNGGKGRKPGRTARALILAPTRELAMQIDRTIQPIARCVGLFTTTIFGGVPQYKQVSALQRGVDIIIATPGRLEDLIEQGRLDLSSVTITVVDEADHMCDLGFLEPVQRILRQTKSGGQRLLFSATLDKGVATLVNEFLTDPAVHEVAGEDQASSTIDHRVLLIEQRDKRAIIEELAHGEGRTLIFARTRAFAEQLADQLDDAGIPATSLHGDLNQSRRTRNLQLLTSGRVNVLVATDVAARGIHVDDISLVIQADAPDEYKSYLHRSGRTGRAGKQGTVVTLIPRARRRRMDELLGRAEIRANTQNAAPGDAVLQELAAL